MIPLKQALNQLPKNGRNLSKEHQPSVSLTRSENDLLDSLGAPKLKNCANDAIIPVISAGILKMGMNPDRVDVVLLAAAADEVRKAHGNLTIRELKLAFDMAMRLELDFEPEMYQNFSLLYLNKLIHAYKKWSSETYKFLRPGSDKENEPEKFVWSPMVYERKSENQLRGEIQLGLQHFRNGILSHVRYIPYEWYHQLVADGFIEYDNMAILNANKKCSDLTEADYTRLRKGQDYVWQLFELAGKRELYAKSV